MKFNKINHKRIFLRKIIGNGFSKILRNKIINNNNNNNNNNNKIFHKIN